MADVAALPIRLVADLNPLIDALESLTPSPSGWQRACRLLERDASRWSSEGRAELEAQLSRWSPMLREAPLRWLTSAMDGEPDPSIFFARALALPSFALADLRWFERALAPLPLRLNRLEIRGAAAQPDAIAALLERLVPDADARLVLSDGSFASEDIHRLLSCWSPRQSVDLNLSHNRINERSLERLTTWSGLSQTTHLNLDDNNINDAGLIRLLAHLDPARLQRLSLRRNPIGRRGLEALLALKQRTPSLGITLSRGALTPRGVQRALSAGLFQGALELSGAPLCPQSVARLRDHRALRTIDALDLSATGTHHRALEQWMTSAELGHLRSLELRSNALDSRGARALHDAQNKLTQLRRLDLQANRLGDQGAHALSQTQLPQLKRLSVGRNSIKQSGLNDMIAAEWFPSLESLDLSYNPLSFENLSALPTRTTRLKRLSLRGSAITDRGLETLINAPWFSTIEHLDLGSTHLSPRAIVALARDPKRQNLRRLDLDRLHNPIDGGVFALACNPRLAGLDHIELDGWNLSQESWLLLLSSAHLSDELKARLRLSLRWSNTLC